MKSLINSNGSIFLVAIFSLLLVAILFITFFFFFKKQDIKFLKPNLFEKHSINIKSSDELIRNGSLPAPEQIIEVNFSFFENPSQKITINSLRVMNGYLTHQKNEEYMYKLQAYDNHNKLLTETKFNIPTHIVPENFIDTAETKSVPKKNDFPLTNNSEILVNLKYDKNISTLLVANNQDEILALKKVSSLKILRLNNIPKFNSFMIKPSTSLIKSFVSAAAADYTRVIDFAFLNYGYDDLDEFHSDVLTASTALTNFDPYSTFAASFRFNYTDLPMKICTKWKAEDIYAVVKSCLSDSTTTLNDAGIPFDKAIILFKSPIIDGSAHLNGTLAAVSNAGDIETVVRHEVGHLFGLDDEYITEERGKNNPASIHGDNCFYGDPDQEKPWPWDTVKKEDIFLGCHWSNWYRSTENSIMNNRISRMKNSDFNEVSKKILTSNLRSFTKTTGTQIPKIGNGLISENFNLTLEGNSVTGAILKDDLVTINDVLMNNQSRDANVSENSPNNPTAIPPENSNITSLYSEQYTTEGIKVPFGVMSLGTIPVMQDFNDQSQNAFANYITYSQILKEVKRKVPDIDIAEAQNLINQGQSEINACMAR